ncbi:hypothetical protein KO02_11475 [Sphingobacterium sp. ML3W]|uniref:hypothetical protein n=1 Tax=Sphingobacterium sp. ML3W TaxID=1538644 RepID=UPI0004F758CF|nr:hypothetical protein [Sphingobacterium sp. ML3W]AIM37240.1 hypothetical protein KO02_11475 [Sphingobacterium sp. ML3W]
MQKTCNRESYALSPREELSSVLLKTRVSIIKKPVMITDLPIRSLKRPVPVPYEGRHAYALKCLIKVRPKERYYSFLNPSKEQVRSYSAVVRDERSDVLRISLAHMAIYECYLFALGLPANFPTEQIIVYGYERAKYIPCKICPSSEKHLYDYELSVPANTEREEYRQRMLNDLNEHFQLDVRVEKLSIVKDSRQIMTKRGESVELIWQEQPTMIMKTKQVRVAASIENRLVASI